MCIERSRPQFDKKKYIEAPQEPDVVIYYREIGRKEPDIIRVYEYEEAYVVCPTGETKVLAEPGFYRIYSRPARVTWVRLSKLTLTVGVPSTNLPFKYGVHADIVLFPKNVQMIVIGVAKVAREGVITIDLIKEELRRILRDAVLNVKLDPNKPRKEIISRIHDEINTLLKRSWLSMFVCDVQGIGFSHECELAKFLEG